ncbi:MAG: ATP-binding protein [Acidobacteria bacterium]|nr:ATP-binding protein [Acidobacteriota bacterium]MCW5969406.1 ATP-binding protein [Blastocatellales bacterium]
MKHFSTAGAIQPDIHYCIPPLERINTKEILDLIAERKYFVLHAPRQTGKTSCLLALRDLLNREKQYVCVYCNVEGAQSARENVEGALNAIVGEIAAQAQLTLGENYLLEQLPAVRAEAREHGLLKRLLTLWAQHSPQPLVLLIDEIDTLIGDSLIAVLRQLRSGYNQRPAAFPQSLILCGVRDVRDYRIHSSATKEIITGGSAFNIKAESLRLGNFTPEDVERLYRQHTAETGQVFADDIFPLVWDWTAGQPWLVNALAAQATWNIKEMRDRALPVTIAVMERAKEELIQRRDTHIDQLYDKLSEARVRRVIEPMLTGAELAADTSLENEVRYVIDLGLIRQGERGLQISNRIYQEIIPRELTAIAQLNLESTQQVAWYVRPDGRLEMDKLMTAFQQFFREGSESWMERFDYKEAGPQLLLQAFLHRVVNGGGRIEREYGLGRGRTDLLVIWNYPGGVQRIVLELKIRRKALAQTITEGLGQTLDYGERCNADELHFVVFDRTKKPWSKKIFKRTRKLRERTIHVWGM